MTDPTEIIAQRYGSGRPRRRGLAIVLGSVFAAALGAWAVWAALAQDERPIEADVVGYRVVSSHQVEVKVAAHVRDPGTDATCLLRATAEDHTVVGELTLTVASLRTFGDGWIPVRTERRATTAEIANCTD